MNSTKTSDGEHCDKQFDQLCHCGYERVLRKDSLETAQEQWGSTMAW